MNDIFSIAFALFLIANPIGNTPPILAIIHSFSFKDQKRIMLRESLFALALALFFLFFGEVFLGLLQISTWAVGFCGGILLLIVALKMILNPSLQESKVSTNQQEPFFVPIATPIITGPGILAMIMLFGRQEQNNLKMTLAILLAWVGVISVMLSGPYLKKVLKQRGMLALEQLMGMMLAFMSVDLIVNATAQFIKQ